MIYFVSDFHLGVPANLSSKERELKIVKFLNEISSNADKIYFVGDIFDYWFEYKTVIPRGFSSFLSKITDLRKKGIDIEFFTGNHDMWMFSFFQKEMGIPVHKDPIAVEINGKTFFIGHGDGLGPGDYSYKFIKRVFRNRFLQFLFRCLHPDLGIRLMQFFSKSSRYANPSESIFLGSSKERLVQFCEDHSNQNEIDYYLFGHRHLPIWYPLKNEKSIYINLGDWLYHYSYAVFDGEKLELKFFENANSKIFP